MANDIEELIENQTKVSRTSSDGEYDSSEDKESEYDSPKVNTR